MSHAAYMGPSSRPQKPSAPLNLLPSSTHVNEPRFGLRKHGRSGLILGGPGPPTVALPDILPAGLSPSFISPNSGPARMS